MVSEAKNIDLKISEEEQVRSDMYNFLSGVLQCEPKDNLIKSYEDLKGDQTPVGQSFSVLSDLACKLSPVDIRSEY